MKTTKKKNAITDFIKLTNKVDNKSDEIVESYIYDYGSKKHLINFHNEFVNKMTKQSLLNKKRGKRGVDRRQHLRIAKSLVNKYSTLIDNKYKMFSDWNNLGKDMKMKQSTIKIEWNDDRKSKKKPLTTNK